MYGVRCFDQKQQIKINNSLFYFWLDSYYSFKCVSDLKKIYYFIYFLCICSNFRYEIVAPICMVLHYQRITIKDLI